MPGMLGILDSAISSYNISTITDSIDLLSVTKKNSYKFKNGLLVTSALSNSPLMGLRSIEHDGKIFCFSGDFTGFREVPWEKIINIFTENKFASFKDFQGCFSFACIDFKAQNIIIVSDRRSQHPVFYRNEKNSFIFSTDLATFCRLPNLAEFNKEWLYTFFFFNFAISQSSFLKNVFRLPPASVLRYSQRTSKLTIDQYANIFRKEDLLSQGKKSFEMAAEIFPHATEKYFRGAEEIACALTDGWDGRTMLAMAPDIKKIVSYTYGVPGCSDLIGGHKTAIKLNVKHKAINFNSIFVNSFREYMSKTVYLSSGLQNILRSTLLFVYESLTNHGLNFPLIISGIALDELFRGHHSSPTPISYDIAKIFKDGNHIFRKDFWQNIFSKQYKDFKNTILKELQYLEDNFGDFKSTEHHLLFKMYMQGPKYFCGELKIAENFSTLRVPSWDTELIQLAFSVKEGALSYSSFSGAHRSNKEIIALQSYLLCQRAPQFSKIPVRNTRPDIALKHTSIYKGYTLYRLLLNKLSNMGTQTPPLEDWDRWLNIAHKDFIEQLIFSPDSLIKSHVSEKFLSHLKNHFDPHWVGKLATVEMILGLIKNHWKLDC